MIAKLIMFPSLLLYLNLENHDDNDDDDLEKDDDAAKVEDIVLEKDEMIILKITTPTFLN